MGGKGSGRKRSCCSKAETQDSTPLDIRKLARESLLVPGQTFSWQWTVKDREVASIDIRVDFELLVLSYWDRSSGNEITQRVCTQTTPCQFGGHRHWFTCPGCGRRVAVLYGVRTYFSCRHCNSLCYASQKEGQGDRAARKANWIRKRLGWPSGILNGSGARPQGMHWTTFWRLQAQHDALTQVSLEEIASTLGLRHPSPVE